MRLLLLSDTHQNFLRSNEWPHPLPEHEILVLAGDISEYSERPGNLLGVLAHYRERTDKPILYLLGNHEFYRQDYHETLIRIRADTQRLGIELLHCRRIQFGDIAFHGCTLWSDFTLHGPGQARFYGLHAEMRVNDFRMIRYKDRKFRHTDCAELHVQERTWLRQSLADSTAAHNVVITHFAPIGRCIAPRFQSGNLNAYFVAACEDLVEQYRPDLWLYGHTHQADDFELGGTRFVNNARGYPKESCAADFRPDKVIEVGTSD